MYVFYVGALIFYNHQSQAVCTRIVVCVCSFLHFAAQEVACVYNFTVIELLFNRLQDTCISTCMCMCVCFLLKFHSFLNSLFY